MIFSMIDLHTHSSASDGKLSPADSARYAVSHNLTVWALTDHDTVSGLHEAALVCKEAGITFVPGIEITVEWPTGEFHLLGQGLTHCSPELAEVIDGLQESRSERNERIIEKMAADGIYTSQDELKAIFGVSQLGRPHFADFLVQKGVVRKRQDAFDKYLAQGQIGRAHV